MKITSWMPLAALLAVTFAAGTMAGIAYERRAPALHKATSMDSQHSIDHIARALDLDSAQRTAIAAILARHQGAVDSAWRALQPHVGATLDSVHREIMTVLTPGQQKRFQSLVTMMHGH
ncbi:MAG TPA: hypothetical protein VGI97_01310 [Gemmatimonadaceae bacterium]|jgi:Spy/CpxP family protein refolding chaperone